MRGRPRHAGSAGMVSSSASNRPSAGQSAPRSPAARRMFWRLGFSPSSRPRLCQDAGASTRARDQSIGPAPAKRPFHNREMCRESIVGKPFLFLLTGL